MPQNTKLKFTDEQLEKLKKYRDKKGCESLTAALIHAINAEDSITPSTSPTKNRTAICMRLDPVWMDDVRKWYGMKFQQVVAAVMDSL